MNFSKYMKVASLIKAGDVDAKTAYWMGVVDGAIITVVIGFILMVSHYG